MSEFPDDAYKDLMDIIHQIITVHASDDVGEMPPSIMGVKFVLNGGDDSSCPDPSPAVGDSD